MNFDQYTDRAKTIVQAAQGLAAKFDHQYLTPSHLGLALLQDPDGLAAKLIDLGGGQPALATKALQSHVQAQPRVSGDGVTQVMLDRDMGKIFEQAQDLAKQRGDQFVTLEIMLLALAKSKSKAAEALAKAGANPAAIDEAIAKLRKGRTADSASAENAYEALSKYGRDLTADAEDGKLDPVIGRDEEIRRVIQILSRRTKNNPVVIGEPGPNIGDGRSDK